MTVPVFKVYEEREEKANQGMKISIRKEKQMRCKECGHKNKEEANFCTYCRSKLRNKCNCWVKKKDNYSCGKSSCPGYAIVIAEIKDETEQKARILKLKEDIEKRIARECETIKKQPIQEMNWPNM